MRFQNSATVLWEVNVERDGMSFTSVLNSMGNHCYKLLWSAEIKALQRPLSPAHQGTKLKPSLYLFWIWLAHAHNTHRHTSTHTHSHTQTLEHKGILSEVDPYQVLCQSPGAMRYLVPRICLNTWASLFGSTDSHTQHRNESKLFFNVINCAALS